MWKKLLKILLVTTLCVLPILIVMYAWFYFDVSTGGRIPENPVKFFMKKIVSDVKYSKVTDIPLSKVVGNTDNNQYGTRNDIYSSIQQDDRIALADKVFYYRLFGAESLVFDLKLSDENAVKLTRTSSYLIHCITRSGASAAAKLYKEYESKYLDTPERLAVYLSQKEGDNKLTDIEFEPEDCEKIKAQTATEVFYDNGK